MPKFKDLTGNKYGRLTVLYHYGKINRVHSWVCKCDCGKELVARGQNMVSGTTRSCGCIHKEQLLERNMRHNLSNTPIYNVWSAMKARCLNSKDKSYKNYGGRGIEVCYKWLNFDGFYEDMNEGYKNGLTLERMDVDGNYCKENCIWATHEQQGNNTRRNAYVEVFGIRDTKANMCRRFNISYTTIKRRLERGWDVEKTFTTPKLREGK